MLAAQVILKGSRCEVPSCGWLSNPGGRSCHGIVVVEPQFHQTLCHDAVRGRCGNRGGIDLTPHTRSLESKRSAPDWGDLPAQSLRSGRMADKDLASERQGTGPGPQRHGIVRAGGMTMSLCSTVRVSRSARARAAMACADVLLAPATVASVGTRARARARARSHTRAHPAARECGAEARAGHGPGTGPQR